MDTGSKGRRSGLLRNLRESKPVTYVELFFDLVFVFALFRISQSLLQGLTWSNTYRILIMLLATWSVWLYTNLLTDSLEPRTIRLQLLVIGSMFGALLMSAAIPEAYTARGLLFAVVYVVINLGRSSYVAFALRNDDLGLRPLRAAFWFAISAGPWIAGAEVEGDARVALWSVAVAIDYVAALLRWPTPRIGPTPPRLLNLASEHFAERYRQFIIIALGETVVAIGTNLHDRDFSVERGAAFTASFVVTGLLFWIYFHRVRERLGPVFAGAPDPGVRNREAGIAHLVMVIGLAAVTTSSDLVITQPTKIAPASWVAVIVGGPGLFLAGHALLARPAFARVAVPRLVGAGLLIPVGAAVVGLPVLAVIGAVAAVLVAVVIWDLTHSGEAGRPGAAAPSVKVAYSASAFLPRRAGRRKFPAARPGSPLRAPATTGRRCGGRHPGGAAFGEIAPMAGRPSPPSAAGPAKFCTETFPEVIDDSLWSNHTNAIGGSHCLPAPSHRPAPVVAIVTGPSQGGPA